jgi:hypothetical protein
LHFRIAVVAKANYGEDEFRYNSSVTRGGLKEVTTSNEPTDDEVARTFRALYDPRGTGRCSDPYGSKLCLLPGNSKGVELIIDGTK